MEASCSCDIAATRLFKLDSSFEIQFLWVWRREVQRRSILIIMALSCKCIVYVVGDKSLSHLYIGTCMELPFV